MRDRSTHFWMKLIRKMNESPDIEKEIPAILQELCGYLGFGMGFVYHADHTATLWLHDRFLQYEREPLPVSIAMETTFSAELLQEMENTHRISVRGDMEQTPLEAVLTGLFQAKAMEIVPIIDQTQGLMGLVGIADRRSSPRIEEDDSAYAQSVLTTLALYIKTELYFKRVQRTQNALSSMLDNMGVDIYVNDFVTHEILYVNKSMAAPYGGVEGMMGKRCWQALYDDKTQPCDYCPQMQLLDEKGQPTKVYSWEYQRPFDGSWFRVFSAAFPWMDGRLAHVVSSVDITESKQNEAVIRRLAEYDTLTGLPNRARLTTDCEAMIDHRRQKEAYILFLDLNGFKQVNDELGHHEGDNLLRMIGETLQNSPLTRDRSYRYGGDEFVILCDGDLQDIRKMLDFLHEGFGSPWQLEKASVLCKPSIGVAHYPTDGVLASELIRKADQSMYTAKNEGGGTVYFFNEGKHIDEKTYFADHSA